MNMVRPRHLGLVVALFALGGCVQPKLSEPSLNQLSQAKEPVFIDTIRISFREEPETDSLLPKLKGALAAIRPTEKPVGQPAILNIHITEFHDMSGAQSLLLGGTNMLAYSVRIVKKKSGAQLYQIDLADQSGYSPGGLIGAMTEASTDDEMEMSQRLTDRVEATVLRANNVTVARGAIIKKVVTSTARKEPARVGRPAKSSSEIAPPHSALAALRSTVPPPPMSKATAFSHLPNGPLKTEEIKALFAGLNAVTSDAEQLYHDFTSGGKMQGAVPGARSSREHGGYSDSGKWTTSANDRLCMKWDNWYYQKRLCFRVTKRHKELTLRDSRSSTDIKYQILN